MKKMILLSLAATVFLGAGCLKIPSFGGEAVVEGDWDLAFDLPAGWVMATPYDADELEDSKFALGTDVGMSDSEIFLQSSDKPIYFSSGTTPEVINGFSSEGKIVIGGSVIKVTRLDERRLIPSEAEDMGDGFFKVKNDLSTADCSSCSEYDYYLETESAKYKFIVINLDRKEAEKIVTSAEVVTVHPEADAEGVEVDVIGGDLQVIQVN